MTRLAAGPLALFLALPAAAQNLLYNPDFTLDLTSWTVPPPAGGSSVVFDASQGSPAAGSALGTDAEPGFTCESLRQCVSVSEQRRYQFAARCQPVPGQTATGGCQLSVSWSTSCGIGMALGNSDADQTSAVAGWTELGGSALAPAGALGAHVTLSVCAGSGGPFQARLDHASFREQSAQGDFDGDGHTDLVLHNGVNGNDRIWLMNGVARLSTNLLPAPPLPSLIVASDDFNLDGRSDLALRDNASGQISFWLMNGATPLGNPLPLSGAATLPAAWVLAATGDFNHDRYPDLLWRNSSTQQLVIWTMTGVAKSGELTPSPAQAVNANWSVAAALDFDGDGQRDLLWYNSTSGKIVLWRMDANVVRLAGEFTSPDSAGNNNWQVRAGGDYGAGLNGVLNSRDLVWRNATSGKFVVWHMDPGSQPLTRTSGEFTSPDAPSPNPLDWTIVGPK